MTSLLFRPQPGPIYEPKSPPINLSVCNTIPNHHSSRDLPSPSQAFYVRNPQANANFFFRNQFISGIPSHDFHDITPPVQPHWCTRLAKSNPSVTLAKLNLPLLAYHKVASPALGLPPIGTAGQLFCIRVLKFTNNAHDNRRPVRP